MSAVNVFPHLRQQQYPQELCKQSRRRANIILTVILLINSTFIYIFRAALSSTTFFSTFSLLSLPYLNIISVFLHRRRQQYP